MKHTILVTLLSLIFVSFAQAGDLSKKQSRKIGDVIDDEPCTCVFNTNRMWNPEKILWNGEEWYCSTYNADGTCGAVALVGPDKMNQDPCTKQMAPLYCVFNLEDAPKFIEIDGDVWECTGYDGGQQCTNATKIKRN